MSKKTDPKPVPVPKPKPVNVVPKGEEKQAELLRRQRIYP